MARAYTAPQTSGCIAGSLFKRLAMPVALKAGQSLFRPGDRADGCYWVHSGVLIVSIVGQGGSDRVVGLAGSGRLVGTLALIDEAPRRTTARTLTSCQLGYVTRAAFGEALRRDPAVPDFVMRQQAVATRQLLERAAVAGLPSARSRVASSMHTFMEHLGREVGEDIVEIGGTVRQADIAATASVTRESVSRVFRHWRREGVLLPGQGGRIRLRRALVAREVGIDD